MIRPMVRTLFVMIASAGMVMTTTLPAIAHANLLSSNIKNHQVFTVKNQPHQIAGRFAEELDPAHSWMAVFEGVGDHGLFTEHRSVVSFRNQKVMTLKLPRLRPEPYYMIWYTRSTQDGHYAAGIVYFTVKR